MKDAEELLLLLAVAAAIYFFFFTDTGKGMLSGIFAFLKIPQYDFAGAGAAAGAAAAGIGGGFSAGGKAESLIPYPQFAEPLYS
ncbi:MAG TPA: hypothetical protein VKW06_07845 [Candidatus Angelobacter sp.]|nr:hypothetical protein [Candidatus Angelobacter sp.]